SLCVSISRLHLPLSPPHPDLTSFPTRRSSDLPGHPSFGRPYPGRTRSVGDATRYRGIGADWGRENCGPPAPARAERFRRFRPDRSEEHTSELQSHLNLVCRLLLEKKKNIKYNI